MIRRTKFWRSLQRLPFPSATRSVMMAPLVGALAGVGAVAFHLLCELIIDVSLVWVAGYDQGEPGSQAGAAVTTPLGIWWLLVIPTVGGLISGLLVYFFAPEAEGHGTDAAIDAYHRKRGVIRARVPLIKIISSAITLGTGGSGGREGPIAQIGAGFGSFLATRLKLTDSDRRILLASGLGAGIGAIFHAPLAGAIFAIEVLYRNTDFEAEALIPAFIATAMSYCVFSIVMLYVTGTTAFQPLFDVPDGLTFNQPWLLLPLTVLAAAMSLAALAYIKCFYGTRNLFQRLSMPAYFKPALGALATGVVAVSAYYGLGATLGADSAHDGLSVLSFGYGYLQKILNPQDATLLIPVLLVVATGKIVTTSLTIGSGGSGGVFGPSMVIGGALGAVVGLLFREWFSNAMSDNDVVMFAILGMASFFAAAANAPVSTLIMVSDLTGSYDLLLPSMWVCALAYLLNGGRTIYREQVASRLESPAHRGDFIIDVLEGMSVRQTLANISRQFITVPMAMSLKEMGQIITSTRQVCFPVVNESGHYEGLFSLNDIRQFLYDSSNLAELAVADDLAQAADPLTLEMDLSSAIQRFAESQFEALPVVDASAPGHVIALLRREDIIAAYSSKLLAVQTP